MHGLLPVGALPRLLARVIPQTGGDGAFELLRTGPTAVDRVGVQLVERCLVLIAIAFGVLYSLQNLDGLIADWPSMSGPLGVLTVAAVGGSCCVALVAVQPSAPARRVLAIAVSMFVAGALLWPFALHGEVPASPFPWLTSMWPVEAVYLCCVSRRVLVPLAGTAVVAGALFLILIGRAGLSATDAVSAVGPMCGICAVLVLLIGALRHRIRHAEASRRTSLEEYRLSERGAATEAERVRTDALVHDSVLTTLLSAAAAASAADEVLASRMARNALRVLAHVNRQDEQSELLPFTLLLRHARRVVPAAFDCFRVDVERADHVTLPPVAADAVLAAMVEAMDNSRRHAGDADRSLTAMPLGPDGIRVLVADDGLGFDASSVLAAGSLHTTVVERMRQVHGRADVVSHPGRGTRVTISWGSVVVSGTRPLDDAMALA